jgi:hypothetical protein
LNIDKHFTSLLVTAGLSLGGQSSDRAIPHALLRLGKRLTLPVLLLALAADVNAHVNSGSDGHDGAFNPNANNPPAIPLV